MVGSALNVHDNHSGQVSDQGRLLDDSIVFSSVAIDSGLSEIVETPSPDTILLIDGKAVPTTSRDELCVVAMKTSLHGWSEGIVAILFCDGSAELVLSAVTPGPNIASLVKSEHVITTGGEVLDVLEFWDLGRSLLLQRTLSLGVKREANWSINSLGVCQS